MGQWLLWQCLETLLSVQRLRIVILLLISRLTCCVLHNFCRSDNIGELSRFGLLLCLSHRCCSCAARQCICTVNKIVIILNLVKGSRVLLSCIKTWPAFLAWASVFIILTDFIAPMIRRPTTWITSRWMTCWVLDRSDAIFLAMKIAVGCGLAAQLQVIILAMVHLSRVSLVSRDGWWNFLPLIHA